MCARGCACVAKGERERGRRQFFLLAHLPNASHTHSFIHCVLKMILLENGNRILEETVLARINAYVLLSHPLSLYIIPLFLTSTCCREKPETVDVTFADFDGVQFHISASPDAKHLLKISAQFKGAQQVLKEFGGLELLKRYYGPLVQASPEASYDITLQVDLSNLPPGKGIYPPLLLPLPPNHITIFSISTHTHTHIISYSAYLFSHPIHASSYLHTYINMRIVLGIETIY